MTPFEAELDADLNSVLRRAPDVDIPRNFGQRLMTRLPEASVAEPEGQWVAPLLAVRAALVLVIAVIVAMETGLVGWFTQTSVLLALLGLESVAALAWFWVVIL